MKTASSATPSGAGLSFFRFSIAFVTMPFFGPSLAGRSNSTTGTFTLTRCAAICAPITPAPRTATFFTLNRLMIRLSSVHADPGLRTPERAERAAHVELLPAFDGREAQAVFAAVLGVEDLAVFPHILAVRLLRAADDLEAFHRFVLAVVAALGAQLAGLGLL